LNHHSGCYWSASDGLLIEARHWHLFTSTCKFY
jgi:hypothetical protein